jgi:hypothetical protein
MSSIPRPMLQRLPAAIKNGIGTLALHTQQIVNLQTSTAALTPGDWEDIDLGGSWSNLAGYTPALARILQNGMVQVVGHISGGATTNGTVIGTLSPGFYSTTYSHAFTANVMSGASAVPVSGTISGSTDSNALADPTISGTTDSNALSDPTISGSTDTEGLPDGEISGATGTVNSGSAGSSSHTHGNGGLAVTDGQHYHTNNSGGQQVANSSHTHTNDSAGQQVANSSHTHTNYDSGQASSTAVNYNTVTITLNTAGQLILGNASTYASELSFNESIPIVT